MASWFFNKEKKKETKIDKTKEKQNKLDFIEKIISQVPDLGKSRAEQTLESIEDTMRNLINDEKTINTNHQIRLNEFDKKIKEIENDSKSRLAEIERENQQRLAEIANQNEREIARIKEEKEKQTRLFRAEADEGKRIENQMVLIWDYWHREVMINNLNKAINSGLLPTERSVALEQMEQLNKENMVLEQGFKKRDIDPKVIKQLKQKLGVLENKDEDSSEL